MAGMSEAPEEEERKLRIAAMQADLNLKQKQSFWEAPKALAAVLAALAAIVALLAGLTGFQLGRDASQRPAPNITVHFDFPPGTSITTPGQPGSHP
jgi:hypothetical protein